MNTIKYLALVLLVLLFTACGSDSEEDEVVGRWSLSQFKVDCPMDVDVSFSFTASAGCYDLDGDRVCFFIDLSEDGTGLITASYNDDVETTAITYTATSSQIIICESSSDCETFQLDGNTLSAVDRDAECEESFLFTKD